MKQTIGIAAATVCATAAALLATTGVATTNAAGETTAGDPEIIAVGDMACDPASSYFKNGLGDSTHCNQLKVANAAATDTAIQSVDRLVGLGDYQYDCGAPEDYAASYTPSWGQFDSVVSPAVGNHEYFTGPGCPSSNRSAATTYFNYFGLSASPSTTGKYSYALGSWLFISLNSECSKPGVGGCGATSPQTVWLKNVLEANATSTEPKPCIAAYWHKPLYTATRLTPTATFRPWWKLLYSYRADVVFNGHAHNYQRFAALNPTTDQPDAQGPTEYLVGTGGVSLNAIKLDAVPQPVAKAKTFGYLRMTLEPNGWTADFVDTLRGSVVTDHSTGTCH